MFATENPHSEKAEFSSTAETKAVCPMKNLETDSEEPIPLAQRPRTERVDFNIPIISDK